MTNLKYRARRNPRLLEAAPSTSLRFAQDDRSMVRFIYDAIFTDGLKPVPFKYNCLSNRLGSRQNLFHIDPLRRINTRIARSTVGVRLRIARCASIGQPLKRQIRERVRFDKIADLLQSLIRCDQLSAMR